MTIREEQRDLFTVPQGYYLAHCISGDYALGAGIAKQFVEVYNMREKLFHQYPIDPRAKYGHVGEALLVDNVFNLVTKPRAFQKPTYDDLTDAIEDMAEQMYDKEIMKLAIPLLGCGLDRLEWDKVKEIIENEFAYTDVDILVCIL